MQCLFCNSITDNKEFCTVCSRSIVEINNNNLWEEEILFLKCDSKKSTLREVDIINIPGIRKPTIINEKDKKVYFEVDDEYINLLTLIMQKQLSFVEILDISKGILSIMKALEENNYILDEISMDDFEVKRKNISTVRYKQVRRISKNGMILDNFSTTNNIICPEKSSGKNLNKSSNVYLFGRIFISLLNKEPISRVDEERYYLYNILLYRYDVPFEYHEFLNKITSIYDYERYPNIIDVIKALNAIETKDIRSVNEKDLECKIVALSDVGKGKLAKSAKENCDINIADKYNEDIYFYDYYNNKKIMAVADGVSTAKYGTGKEASNILKKQIQNVWQNRKENIMDINGFKDMIIEICKLTNEEIINIVSDSIDKTHDKSVVNGVMASTLVIALIIDNKMYYSSIGDSFIYMYNPKFGLSILNIEDNVGNDYLKNNYEWSKVLSMENKDYISNYIGKFMIKNGELISLLPNCVVNETYIEKGEIILLCSDGIVDYILPVDNSRNIWTKDTVIKDILSDSNKSIEHKCSSFIDECNKNGGGDNLTIVLAEIM